MQPDQLSQDLASLKIDRGVKPRSRGARIAALAIVIIAIAVAAGVFGYGKLKSSLLTPEVTLGEISLVSPAQSQVQLTATGYVVALTYAKVASRVAGRIAELFVDEGDTIKQGQRVARLEDVDFKTALATARARAAVARAQVAVARAALAEIHVQIAREAPLVEKGVSPKATLEDLQTRSDSAVAGIHAAQAQAAATDAETQALEIQLGSYEIISPISGTVVDRLVKVGEGVSPGFGTPGVIEVVDMTSLVVEVDVPEGRLSQVRVRGPCEIVLDANPNKRYRGSVKEIGQRVNRSKASVPVKVQFDDHPDPAVNKDDVKVLPDMAARVNFLGEALDAKAIAAPPKLIVPHNAIAQRGGRDVVFIYDEGDVRMTPVTLGPPFADGRELVSKIPEGTKVVLDPLRELADGQQVKERK